MTIEQTELEKIIFEQTFGCINTNIMQKISVNKVGRSYNVYSKFIYGNKSQSQLLAHFHREGAAMLFAKRYIIKKRGLSTEEE